jgi:peptidoglycan/LPS O-acetylase OafA/YrhL
MIFLAFYGGPVLIFGQTISIFVTFGMCFSIFAYCLADGAANWLGNPPIRYLGKVSFSAYLWHFAVLGSLAKLTKSGFDPLMLAAGPHGFSFFCVFFPFLVIVTTVLSTLTYRLVERPIIRFGEKLLNSSKFQCIIPKIAR